MLEEILGHIVLQDFINPQNGNVHIFGGNIAWEFLQRHCLSKYPASRLFSGRKKIRGNWKKSGKMEEKNKRRKKSGKVRKLRIRRVSELLPRLVW